MTAKTQKFEHFSATIHLPGHRFPLIGQITDGRMQELANHGTTPARVTPKIEAEAARIRAELEAGRTVLTGAAAILPISAEEYERIR